MPECVLQSGPRTTCGGGRVGLSSEPIGFFLAASTHIEKTFPISTQPRQPAISAAAILGHQGSLRHPPDASTPFAPIMGNADGRARKVEDRLLEGAEQGDVGIICWLVEEKEVAALADDLRQSEAIPLPSRQHRDLLLLVASLEVEPRAVRPYLREMHREAVRRPSGCPLRRQVGEVVSLKREVTRLEPSLVLTCTCRPPISMISSPSPISSTTVLSSARSLDCSTYIGMTVPPIFTSPESGCSWPMIIRKRVDLPAPATTIHASHESAAASHKIPVGLNLRVI